MSEKVVSLASKPKRTVAEHVERGARETLERILASAPTSVFFGWSSPDSKNESTTVVELATDNGCYMAKHGWLELITDQVINDRRVVDAQDNT